jgi:hypothetical protein
LTSLKIQKDSFLSKVGGTPLDDLRQFRHAPGGNHVISAGPKQVPVRFNTPLVDPYRGDPSEAYHLLEETHLLPTGFQKMEPQVGLANFQGYGRESCAGAHIQEFPLIGQKGHRDEGVQNQFSNNPIQ